MRLIPLCLPVNVRAAIKLAMKMGFINADAHTYKKNLYWFLCYLQLRDMHTLRHTHTHLKLSQNKTLVIRQWKPIISPPIIIALTKTELHAKYEEHQSCAGHLFACEFFNICLIGLNGQIYNVCFIFSCGRHTSNLSLL